MNFNNLAANLASAAVNFANNRMYAMYSNFAVNKNMNNMNNSNTNNYFTSGNKSNFHPVLNASSTSLNSVITTRNINVNTGKNLKPNYTKIATLTCDIKVISSVKFSPDSNWLASSCTLNCLIQRILIPFHNVSF